MQGPLDGVRIVEVSQVMYGPFDTMILADQGAEVVKIEPPGIGDVSRQPSYFERGGLTAAFANLNRNKRGMAVDITRPEGLKIVDQLVADTDVFVQNWRPGVAERNKLGEADLRKITPDLIYCSLSGYGPTGPYADRRAYDPTIQCLTGLPAVQNNPDFRCPTWCGMSSWIRDQRSMRHRQLLRRWADWSRQLPCNDNQRAATEDDRQ